jgi:hypothetical protein
MSAATAGRNSARGAPNQCSPLRLISRARPLFMVAGSSMTTRHWIRPPATTVPPASSDGLHAARAGPAATYRAGLASRAFRRDSSTPWIAPYGSTGNADFCLASDLDLRRNSKRNCATRAELEVQLFLQRTFRRTNARCHRRRSPHRISTRRNRRLKVLILGYVTN